MTVFIYDYTFDGLLTSVFDAYSSKIFPDMLVREGSQLPLFSEVKMTIATDEAKAKRVWKGIQKKLSATALSMVTYCWMSQEDGIEDRIFRFIRKTIDSPISIETNFADLDVLYMSRLFKRVSYESRRMLQFLRFQKAADGTFFAPIDTEYNVLPLIITHFKERFNDQPWLIYDTRREYGYYYDTNDVQQVTFQDPDQMHLITGKLKEGMMDSDELLFQKLWKTYFKSVCIKERLNPRKHKQDMPVRYWKYITEKQI